MFLEIAVSPESLWGLAGAVVVLRSLSAPTSHEGGKNYIFFFIYFFFAYSFVYKSWLLRDYQKTRAAKIISGVHQKLLGFGLGFFFFFSVKPMYFVAVLAVES